MKKTLALLLALLMIFSVALVSCGDDEEEATTTDPESLFGDVTDEEPEDDEKEDATKDEDAEDDGSEDNEGEDDGLPTGYETTNDTVYVAYEANLRSDDKSNASVVATVEFGTALTRVAKGKKWSQISFDGKDAYIANDLITESKDSITFNDVEEETTRKVTKLGTSKHANLRLYPLALAKTTVVDMEAFNANCIIGCIPKDAEVKVLKVSADNAWAYIECQGYASTTNGEYAKELTTLTGYCSTSVFDTGFGPTNSGNSSNGVLG